MLFLEKRVNTTFERMELGRIYNAASTDSVAFFACRFTMWMTVMQVRYRFQCHFLAQLLWLDFCRSFWLWWIYTRHGAPILKWHTFSKLDGHCWFLALWRKCQRFGIYTLSESCKYHSFSPNSWGFLVNRGGWRPRNFLNQRSPFLELVETSFVNFIHLDNKTTLAVYQKLQCVMARRADAGYQAGLLKSWCLFQKASHASDEIKNNGHITVFINSILPRCQKEL